MIRLFNWDPFRGRLAAEMAKHTHCGENNQLHSAYSCTANLYIGKNGKLEEAMWYVIQTITGKEEELLTFIRTILDRELYTDCFVIKAEWMKRLGGEWQVQVRPLFPGYVFIDTEMPENLFFKLKSVPRFSKLLGNGKNEFIAVDESEKEFLEVLAGDRESMSEAGGPNKNLKWVVKRSLIETDEDGTVTNIQGPLKYFQAQIRQINYHKRYAVVEMNLFQRDQTVLFGIRLKKDLALGETDVSEKCKENT